MSYSIITEKYLTKLTQFVQITWVHVEIIIQPGTFSLILDSTWTTADHYSFFPPIFTTYILPNSQRRNQKIRNLYSSVICATCWNVLQRPYCTKCRDCGHYQLHLLGKRSTMAVRATIKGACVQWRPVKRAVYISAVSHG